MIPNIYNEQYEYRSYSAREYTITVQNKKINLSPRRAHGQAIAKTTMRRLDVDHCTKNFYT
jgi:hypothetical protein